MCLRHKPSDTGMGQRDGVRQGPGEAGTGTLGTPHCRYPWGGLPAEGAGRAKGRGWDVE